MSHAPIAFTYDADVHCPDCATARFGVCTRGQIACPGFGPENGACDGHARDREGNTPGAIFTWSEWWEPSEPFPQVLACGDCGREIDEVNADD